MSPGATFERVYNELKRMLAEGELPPGSPIEPALIGKRIASSITPIRDALHRLTGERLVEAPNHNGFRAQSLNEKALRDLYGWNWQMLEVFTRHSSAAIPLIIEDGVGEEVATASAKLFEKLARRTQNSEHLYAHVLCVDT
eukprot:Opistho-1_new@13306